MNHNHRYFGNIYYYSNTFYRLFTIKNYIPNLKVCFLSDAGNNILYHYESDVSKLPIQDAMLWLLN